MQIIVSITSYLDPNSRPGRRTLIQSILSFAAFITTLLYDAVVDLWVGLTSDSKGHFQWARNGLLSYTNWAPGEPLDNSGPHHNRTPVMSMSARAVSVFVAFLC